jgi:hypothetical protein
MLHRLDNACIIKRSDAVLISQMLSIHGHEDLASILKEALGELLGGWVAVPYEASKAQLKGSADYPISLGRWQSILESSPQKPGAKI